MVPVQPVYSEPSPGEAGDLALLHATCWREAYAGIVPASILDNMDMEHRTARWRSYLETQGYPTYLARADGEPMGFIRAGALAQPLAERDDGHIFGLYIRQRYHRQGVGRKLIGLVAARWIGQGGRALSVGVLSANRSARDFYEALGARFVRPDIYDWDGHALGELVYLFENLSELARFA